MQDEQSQEVTRRFFEAIAQLKSDGKIGGKQPLCEELGINRRHLWILENDHSRDMMKLRWLTALVMKYGVSADWLLTGRGTLYK